MFMEVPYKSLIFAPSSHPQDFLTGCCYFPEMGKDNVTGEARKERQQALLLADQSTGY